MVQRIDMGNLYLFLCGAFYSGVFFYPISKFSNYKFYFVFPLGITMGSNCPYFYKY